MSYVQTERPTATVTFRTNGGTDVSSDSVAQGTAVSAPANPARYGYDFAGWYADEGLTTPYDFATPVTSNITLHAAWDAWPFTDTPTDSWHVDGGYLDYVVQNGLMTGIKNPDQTMSRRFEPESGITHGQVATILYRYANPCSTDTTDPANYATKSSFKNVPAPYYYTAAIEWCYKAGVVTGYRDPATQQPTGNFGPEDPVTRTQLAR